MSGLSFKSSLPGIALLFFSIIGAEAQPSRFFHLNMTNGLSDNFVSSLAIDKQGFLWIGTLEGLNVFDGYSITSYFKKRQPELASNNIIHLTCDRNNRIWMGSNEGASWLDEKRTFHRVIVQDTIKDFVCRTILDTKKYGPVVFTSLGQFFLSATKHKWEKLNFIPDQARYQLFSDAEHFAEDRFIYGTSEGVMLFDYATSKIIFEMPMKGIVSLCRYSDHEIAVAFRNDGVKIVDINSKRIVKEFPLTRQLNNRTEKTVLDEIRPAINNTLLIGSDHAGLIMIDSSDNISWLLHDPINPNSIGSNHVRRLLCSDEGDILIGSTIAGVSSFDLLNRVSGYKNMFHDGHGNFYDSYIADITEDKKGVLWMGGFEKMIAWDRKNNDVKFYKYYSEVEGYGYEIRAICIDSLGRKWAGSLNNGLSLLNEKKGDFISIRLDSTKGEALKDKNILDLQTASDGIIWAIGIHTGDAVTGNIGNNERQQYSITGNVVILASRIEQLNKEFNSQFLVSGEVVRSIDRSINSELMGAVNIKGWAQPVPVYKLA